MRIFSDSAGVLKGWKCLKIVLLLQLCYFMFDVHVALHNLGHRSCRHFVHFSVRDVIFFSSLYILAEKDNQRTVLQGSKILFYHWKVEWITFTRQMLLTLIQHWNSVPPGCWLCHRCLACSCLNEHVSSAAVMILAY